MRLSRDFIDYYSPKPKIMARSGPAALPIPAFSPTGGSGMGRAEPQLANCATDIVSVRFPNRLCVCHRTVFCCRAGCLFITRRKLPLALTQKSPESAFASGPTQENELIEPKERTEKRAIRAHQP